MTGLRNLMELVLYSVSPFTAQKISLVALSLRHSYVPHENDGSLVQSTFLVEPSSSSLAQNNNRRQSSSPMAQAVAPLLPPPPPPPPPPLPPPPPSLSLSSRSGSGSGRLRSVFWERIPQERVEGRRSVWTKSDEFLIDLSSLDELFGQQQGHQIKVPGVRGHRAGDKHTNTDVPRQNTPERISILEGNRSLKVGIFLHHLKSSLGEIINDIREGRGQRYGSEKLRDLYRLLPECEEASIREQRLRSFRGERRQLEEADLFMIQLVEIPSFRLRLEAMILQEEFDLAVTSVSTSARCLATAATELMSCVELHSILRLVLKAGNYMNAGGFAGNAAGFRISSLLKLADTKANRPGMNLLHFVAMEAVKRDPSILSYHLKLHHLGPAARLSVEAVQEEFAELQCRVTALLEGLGTAPDLQSQLTPFLQAAELKLSELQADVGSMYEAQRSLLEFFCEDDDGSLKLEEACATFHNFQQRFLRAAQENEQREKQDLRRLERQQTGKRHSIASCSIVEAGPEFDDEALEMILRAPVSTPPRRSLWTSPSRRTPQRPSLISLLETPAEHSPPGNEARTQEEVPDSVAASNEAAKKDVATRTEPERTRLASPSPTPGSARSSGHSPRNLSPSHTPGVRLRPHVGETHILVSGLRSYSSLAPPTGGADQEDKTQQTGERLEEAEPEVRAVTSSHTSRRQRGKLDEWTTRHVSQSQSRTHTATPLPRTSRLPLPMIGQQIVTHSGTVGGASEREGPKAKLPQPLKRLLDRASSRKEKDQREKEKREKQKAEKDRERREKERREKEGEEREKEVREKQKAENDKERKEKGEKEREMLEREKEKKEKERKKERKENEREKEKKEKEREKREREKERKEKEKVKSGKERDRGAKGRSMERSLSPASALAMSMSRPLSRLCPAAAPMALASIRYTAKALHSALKRDSSGSSSRIPAPTSTRTLSLPRSDTDTQHA
ncbi:hypothetical protein NFI96_032210 [Prochilodus magdalenae]|nr:hypothetical protein NFI96_032210 [Prochilodus magdalenae]